MKVNKTAIINSNVHHFCSPPKGPNNIKRINPDKFTFLKSNLLVSNILYNHHYQQRPIRTNNDENDAYV
jgi:hypothetical protein